MEPLPILTTLQMSDLMGNVDQIFHYLMEILQNVILLDLVIVVQIMVIVEQVHHGVIVMDVLIIERPKR